MIRQKLDANYPILSMTTPEEARAELLLIRTAEATKRNLYVWSVTRGLREFVKGGYKASSTEFLDPQIPLKAVQDKDLVKDRSILVLMDFNPYLKDPLVIRLLRDATGVCKDRLITIVLLGPALDLPIDLQREISAVDLELPGEKEIEQLIEATHAANSSRKDLHLPQGEALNRVIEAAKGLTTTEIENALALSIVTTRQLTPKVIAEEKARVIKISGALEVLKPLEGGLDMVGGLAGIKDWVVTRGRAFSAEAKAYGLHTPKGVLIVGIPGTGKSLSAKAAGAALGLPTLRLDIGSLFGSLVGDSEANTRSALKTVDAVAPCVLMIDELEKAFAGSAAGASHDSGVSSRVLGTFLGWLQDHESPVFLFATANNVSALPPELLRRGRWDTMMFADLPGPADREAIFRIHLIKRKRNPGKYDPTALALASSGYSGAEIEQAITDAMFLAFSDGGREFDTRDIVNALVAAVPLSKTMAEQITAMREWAKTRCTSASGMYPPQGAPVGKPISGRKVAMG